MKLIVGLGNPEKKYAGTRHNAGFDALIEIQRELVWGTPFSEWSKVARMRSVISDAKLGDEKIVLLMPQTYMNLSGEAVNIASVFYKMSPEDIWVIHDDIDLPLGRIRINFDGTSGGHKGIESVINHLGSKKFYRFRIGIRPPESEKIETEKFVLQKFSKVEEPKLLDSLHRIRQAIELSLRESLAAAMNKFN